MLPLEKEKKTLTLPSPASGRGEKSAGPDPFFPLAGEGWG
jgi:hypothetical protein